MKVKNKYNKYFINLNIISFLNLIVLDGKMI